MTPSTIDINVFESLRNAADSARRDHSLSQAEAWTYGIVIGWGDALPDVAACHDWNEKTVVRLRTLRAVFELVEENARLDWAMMARAIERAGLPATMIRKPGGAINNCALANGFDASDCQVCGGACPDKARYER